MTVTRRPTEAACQATLIAAATRGQWHVHAERPAQVRSGRWATNVQGHTGWPDLALAHPTRGFLLVELKRRPNRIEPAQQAWHDMLRAAGVDVRVWWVPDDLDLHVAWLLRGPVVDTFDGLGLRVHKCTPRPVARPGVLDRYA